MLHIESTYFTTSDYIKNRSKAEQDKTVKLQAFDSTYFRGKSHFEDDETHFEDD